MQMAAVTNAFMYISALMGAGFATGKELYYYFFCYGLSSGMTGILVSALLFGESAYKTQIIVGENNIRCYKDLLIFLFGNFGKLLNIACTLFFIILFAAMTAAMGELLHTLFAVNKTTGNILMCILCLPAAIKKTDILKCISNILCPVMILGCCAIGILCTDINAAAFTAPEIKVIPSAIIYTAYNIMTSTAVLCTAGKATKKQAISTAFMIAVAVFAAGSISGAATLGIDSPLPIFFAVKSKKLLCFLYITVLISAMLTTAMGSIVCLLPEMPGTYIYISGFALSIIGFDKIVENIYFLFGILGCGILAALLFCPTQTNFKEP